MEQNNLIGGGSNKNTDITNNISFGIVIDDNDPESAHRIRVLLDGERLSTANYTKWGPDDPFVINSFLPKYINMIPQKGETVKVLTYDTASPKTQRDYIGPVISQLQNLPYEDSLTSKLFYGQRVVKPKEVYTNIPTAGGVFPNRLDFTIYGRGTADIVVGKNQILLRSGKYLNDITQYNSQNSFFQLTSISEGARLNDVKTLVTEVKTIPVNYVITYDLKMVTNGYVCEITVYNTNNLTSKSNVYGASFTNNKVSAQITITSNSMKYLISEVNRILDACRTNQLKSQNNYGSEGKTSVVINDENVTYNAFHFVPTVETIQGVIEDNEYDTLIKSVSLEGSVGYGFYSKQNLNVIKEVSTKTTQSDLNAFNFGVLKTDNIFLLSNKTQIPAKKKVKNNQSNALGYNQIDVMNDLIKNTEGIARGEQLVKALTLIIDAFLDHVHSGFGFQEVNQTERIKELAKMKSNLHTLIVNPNIRIN